MKKVTWKQVLLANDITDMEDPVTGSEYCKHYYYKIYGKVLDELDGTDLMSYVSFFFERHPIRPYCLRFIGDNEKFDFMDWAIEFEILPPMEQIQTGEDDNDVKEKIEKEKKHKKNIKKQQAVNQQKKEKINPFEADLGKIIKIFQNCQKLSSQGEKKKKKLEKANSYLLTCWKPFHFQYEGNIKTERKENIILQQLLLYIQ